MAEILFGSVEAGGTKFICLIGTSPQDVRTQVRIPTTRPEETIRQVLAFFKPFADRKELAAIGVGSFGPVDLEPASPTFGFITSTPKPGWQKVDLVGPLRQAFGVPISFDTDVNAAAFGEQFWVPANRGLDPLLYLTVGTGIGVGVLVNGAPLHGLMHAEAGHMLLPHDRERDPFAGFCPFHKDCWEGLASGPAMAARWGVQAEELPVEHPGWMLEAHYIALAVSNLILMYSPRKIILGGGVAQHAGLLDDVRSETVQILASYVPLQAILDHMDTFLVAPELGNAAGALGALAMAIRLAR